MRKTPTLLSDTCNTPQSECFAFASRTIEPYTYINSSDAILKLLLSFP